MTQTLQPGGNILLEAFSGTVIVSHKIDQKLDINLTAFILSGSGKVLNDSGVVFFNQPSDPASVAVFSPPKDVGEQRKHQIDFDLSKAPTNIAKVSITLTEDHHNGFALASNLKAEVHAGGQVVELVPASFSSENGIIVLELYVRNNQAKARAIWQGFASGLAGLCEHYGVEVQDSPSEPAKIETKAAQQPANSSSSLAINLEKASGKIDLVKGQKPIVIEKTAEITASISWRSGTDYDVYALVYTTEGKQIDVAMFGADGIPPLQNYQNGAIEHLGDVGRGKSKVKTETIKIRLTENILAVVPVAYSAQSNGTGSFRRYKVSMLIDNHSGTTVNIDANNANKDNRVYTCVPGIIMNTVDGIVIKPVEYYSSPGSERRPKLRMGEDGFVDVDMDAGPVNDFK
ncbi:TerD family protein [Endozoicomonas sp. SM1973]|uniref:TerD family protein n=1 Tax=Spartinivicinus marinus TaxID=2994442 RepID=A0A853I0Q5_9GAMM|nr:TerD family protein [Spartinivicinus marinus]MCX4028136.1 TerD family protein [Spartinivicinus marinus]NYZ66189.1 TerD family protein [Spartinivicinus marinus]